MKKLIKHWNITLGVLLMIVLGGMIVFAPLLDRLNPYAPPLLEHELDDLTPDWSLVTDNNWSPWYATPEGTTIWSPAKSFNAWLETVPEEDKAWPLLLDAYFAHEELFEHEDIGRSRWEADDWHGLVKLLEQSEHAQVVPDLLEALSKPVLGCGLYASTDPVLHAKLVEYGQEDPDWDPALREDSDLFHAFVPSLGKQRNARRLLLTYAVINLEQGDIDGALTIFETVFNSTRHGHEYPSALGSLVEIADRKKTLDLLLPSIIDNPNAYTEPRLARVDAMLSQASHARMVWTSEVLMFHDLVRRLASPTGGLNHAKAEHIIEDLGTKYILTPANNLPAQQLKPVLQRPLYLYGQAFSRIENQSDIPWEGEVIGGYDYVMTEFESVHPIFKDIIDIIAATTDKATAVTRHYNQQLHAGRLLVAAHRARLRHGQFLDTIEAIDKDLLPITPVDAFSDEPLKYRVVDTKHGPSLLIYSVGTDRDDDEGWPMRTYDLSDLDDVDSTGVMFEKDLPPIATSPHWITRSRVNEINAIDPNLINGDWVLYPIPDND